ncbi:hypothetical protein G5714_012753 [Onychostoma macrolepis]|uniref:Uncharacterized protein n=1 Tax=Onychostoma macrolepis TaxID=369639 RepID=A0A7J6CJR1_9TELE|nr:hypothetical protein G5714_012753 [Onychostoma macrolepis]
MSSTDMENVLSYIGEDLRKQTISFRVPVEPQQRLAVTLRYLATGDSMHSLAYCYRLGVQTVSDCIKETCRAIEKRMLPVYLPKPTEGMDINLMPDTTDTLIVVTCILHNMLTRPGEAEHWLREASEDVPLRG